MLCGGMDSCSAQILLSIVFLQLEHNLILYIPDLRTPAAFADCEVSCDDIVQSVHSFSPVLSNWFHRKKIFCFRIATATEESL